VATEVPVHVGAIIRATLRSHVTAYGAVEAEPPGERPAGGARVAPSVAGIVTAVTCAEGRRVEKGAVLFQLDSRAADVAVEKARRALDFAEKTSERQKKLLEVEGTSQKLVLDAEQSLTAVRGELATAQTQQALLQVQAPLAGSVVRVYAKPGEAVDLTSVLAEIIDLDRLVVNAAVPSTELSAVKVGMSAEVCVEGAPALNVTIAYISAQVDAKTGTALVRAALPPNSGVRPGSFVTLRIVSAEHKDCLAAPAESVVKDEEGATVIAVVEGENAKLRAVSVGLRDRGLVEVAGDSVREGLTVVTQGAYGLPKETKIRVWGKAAAEKEETQDKEKPGHAQ
jgi:membrane fusion protein (multidrug efflux system)